MDRSLNIYLRAIEGKTEKQESEKLLKIGELAKEQIKPFQQLGIGRKKVCYKLRK